MSDCEDFSSTCSTYVSDEQESDSDDNMSLFDLLLQMQETNENITISENGYKYSHTICDTLQGELIKAVVTSSSKNIPIGSHVAIKKSDKLLLQQHIAIEDDMTFIVEENLLKEASILKQLTESNGNTNIVQYIDCFESNDYVYLVMEYIDNAVTLKEFIATSHQLIRDGKLMFKEYSKTIKCLMYQLSTTIEWLHNTAHCCHLDLGCLENIMVQNYKYNKNKKYLTTNDSIRLRLLDFGVADIYAAKRTKTSVMFSCTKTALTLDNGHFLAPEISIKSKYDARAVDIWSLGLILYHCMVGKSLYEPKHLWDKPKHGYAALKTNKLREHLSVYRLLKYFKGSSYALLHDLLAFNANKRINASCVVRHRWFMN